MSSISISEKMPWPGWAYGRNDVPSMPFVYLKQFLGNFAIIRASYRSTYSIASDFAMRNAMRCLNQLRETPPRLSSDARCVTKRKCFPSVGPYSSRFKISVRVSLSSWRCDSVLCSLPRMRVSSPSRSSFEGDISSCSSAWMIGSAN